VIIREVCILYLVILWQGGLEAYTSNYCLRGRGGSESCRECNLSFRELVREGVHFVVTNFSKPNRYIKRTTNIRK